MVSLYNILGTIAIAIYIYFDGILWLEAIYCSLRLAKNKKPYI